MADCISHFADLARAAFVNGHAQDRRVRFGAPLAQQFDACGARPAAFDDNAARETIDVVRIGNAEHLRLVHTLDLVSWMHQRGGEIAVVGEKKQAFYTLQNFYRELMKAGK